ncbi:MAG: DMT family transporter [Aquisalimonadaceae bacterium]
MQNATLGILLTILAGITLASMDSLGKFLGQHYPVMQVVWSRYFFHALLVVVILLARGHRGFLRSRRPGLQAARSVTLLAVSLLIYTALIRIPLADATAVMFFAPVLVTLMSGLLLSERVTRVRILAVLAGFIGVLLIVRPGLHSDWYMLLPLAAALMLTTYLLLTRALAGSDDNTTTLFYTTAPGAVLLTLMLPLFWQMPETPHLFLMLATGALGALGHGLIVAAFAFAPASVLSPFLYSQILAAMVISLLIFGDPLTALMLAGTALLVGGGLSVWWAESRKADA